MFLLLRYRWWELEPELECDSLWLPPPRDDEPPPPCDDDPPLLCDEYPPPLLPREYEPPPLLRDPDPDPEYEPRDSLRGAGGLYLGSLCWAGGL
jgi:hypothetical protein